MKIASLLERRRSFEGVLVAATGVGMASSILIARSLGPAGRGKMTFVAIWVQVGGFAGAFMLDTAIIVLAKRPGAHVNPDSGLFEAGRLSVWLSSIAAGCVLALALAVTHQTAIGAVMVVGVYATAALELMNGYLVAADRRSAYLSNRITQPVIFAFGIGVIALALGRRSLQTQVVFMAVALDVSLATPALLSFLRFHPKRSAHSATTARSLFRFARGAQLASALQYMNARLDLLALPLRFPSSLVGLYAIAVAPSGFLVFMGSPGLLRALTGENITRDRRAIFAVITGAAIWFVTCGWLIPAVFGVKFEPSIPVARVLAVGAIPAFVLQQVSGELLKRERTYALAIAQGLGAMVFVIGFLLSQTMVEVAWASASSYLVSLLVGEAFLFKARQDGRVRARQEEQLAERG